MGIADTSFLWPLGVVLVKVGLDGSAFLVFLGSSAPFFSPGWFHVGFSFFSFPYIANEWRQGYQRVGAQREHDKGVSGAFQSSTGPIDHHFETPCAPPSPVPRTFPLASFLSWFLDIALLSPPGASPSGAVPASCVGRRPKNKHNN